MNEQEIRRDESNKHALQQYWRPEKPTASKGSSDYSDMPNTDKRPLPKRPDSV